MSDLTYSAGIIPFRRCIDGELEFFLGHPGGLAFKYVEYWTYLKGRINEGETWLEAAIREFKEESGIDLSDVDPNSFIPLGSLYQNVSKVVIAFAIEKGDIEPDDCHSNLTEEGTPEIDRYRWFPFRELEDSVHDNHLPFYDKIVEIVGKEDGGEHKPTEDDELFAIIESCKTEDDIYDLCGLDVDTVLKILKKLAESDD